MNVKIVILLSRHFIMSTFSCAPPASLPDKLGSVLIVVFSGHPEFTSWVPLLQLLIYLWKPLCCSIPAAATPPSSASLCTNSNIFIHAHPLSFFCLIIGQPTSPSSPLRSFSFHLEPDLLPIVPPSRLCHSPPPAVYAMEWKLPRAIVRFSTSVLRMHYGVCVVPESGVQAAGTSEVPPRMHHSQCK